MKNALFITQESIGQGAIKQRHLVPSPTRKGDLYYGKDGNSFANLPIGKVGQVLTVSGGVPIWQYLLTTGVAANRPTTGAFTGAQYFATDTFALSVWTGAAWKSVTLS